MYLIFDTNYLCHRAFYSTGHLSHKDIATGMVYGVLRDIEELQDRFDPTQVIFAFDKGKGKRRELCSTYKDNRGKTDEEIKIKTELNKQIDLIRTKYLRQLGYRNIFYSPGFEADDIIASLVLETIPGEETVIVSADEDLWQLLSVDVSCFNPRGNKLTTRRSFMKEWGIDPVMWADAKAYAGCPSDHVIGIHGIGMKTAVKWLMGRLTPRSRAYQVINANLDVYTRNIKLVRLPFPGTPIFKLKKDKVTLSRWRRLRRDLGFKRK